MVSSKNDRGREKLIEGLPYIKFSKIQDGMAKCFTIIVGVDSSVRDGDKVLVFQ